MSTTQTTYAYHLLQRTELCVCVPKSVFLFHISTLQTRSQTCGFTILKEATKSPGKGLFLANLCWSSVMPVKGMLLLCRCLVTSGPANGPPPLQRFFFPLKLFISTCKAETCCFLNAALMFWRGQRKYSGWTVKKDWLRREIGVAAVVGSSGNLKTCNKRNRNKFCCTWL